METVTIHKAKTQTQLSRLIEKACRGGMLSSLAAPSPSFA